jgi:hypothetical protein
MQDAKAASVHANWNTPAAKSLQGYSSNAQVVLFTCKSPAAPNPTLESSPNVLRAVQVL